MTTKTKVSVSFLFFGVLLIALGAYGFHISHNNSFEDDLILYKAAYERSALHFEERNVYYAKPTEAEIIAKIQDDRRKSKIVDLSLILTGTIFLLVGITVGLDKRKRKRNNHKNQK